MAEIGGPRSSSIVPLVFDWQVLIGDESAFRQSRAASKNSPDACAFVVAIVDSERDRIPFAIGNSVDVTWLYRSSGDESAQLTAHCDRMDFPAGEGYLWIACEATLACARRDLVRARLALSDGLVRAAGYWRHGAIAAHERLDVRTLRRRSSNPK